jgi:hypothetical protein
MSSDSRQDKDQAPEPSERLDDEQSLTSLGYGPRKAGEPTPYDPGPIVAGLKLPEGPICGAGPELDPIGKALAALKDPQRRAAAEHDLLGEALRVVARSKGSDSRLAQWAKDFLQSDDFRALKGQPNKRGPKPLQRHKRFALAALVQWQLSMGRTTARALMMLQGVPNKCKPKISTSSAQELLRRDYHYFLGQGLKAELRAEAGLINTKLDAALKARREHVVIASRDEQGRKTDTLEVPTDVLRSLRPR